METDTVDLFLEQRTKWTGGPMDECPGGALAPSLREC
jgi:hypothetical protein